MTVTQRFEAKFVPEPNTGCFIWTGGVDEGGYGRFLFEGRNRKASRIAWLLANGDAGELHVLHRCDTPACVNPDHLFLGTIRDNNMDRARKGRTPIAKLTKDDVRAIRLLRREGWSLGALGKVYGVSAHTIRNADIGKNFSYVA